MKDHILLTSLGMRAIPTTYQWNGKTATAPLTPLALLQFFDSLQQPNRVIAMVTDGARHETWPVFKAEICNNLEIKPEAIDVPDGKSPNEIGEILEKVAQEIPEGSELTLDVTQGFRHFPFIFYALVLYLKSLRGVKIRGAYYGLIEVFPPDSPIPRPIIDLQPLLELPEWFHAVRMFRDQGTTEPIAQRIQPIVQPIADVLKTQAEDLNGQAVQLYKSGDKAAGDSIRKKQKSKRGKFDQITAPIDALKEHAFAYESALPLELGKASRLLSDAIGSLSTIASADLPPLVEVLTNDIRSTADESAFKTASKKKKEWKQEISLTDIELERQAGMIDEYLKRGQFPLAFGLMREWGVSWAILKSSVDKDIQNWLKRNVRERYEGRLGALGALAREDGFRDLGTCGQKKFGNFWNHLVNLRNKLHHHGMRLESCESESLRGDFKRVEVFWNRLKANNINLPELGGGKGTLLLSPQGTRPGVLFSALKVAKPDVCVVICSNTSTSGIDDAAKKAKFTGDIEQIILSDPHGGFSEIEKAKKQVRRLMLDADEIAANLTGGTTLMGIIVQRLSEEAKKLARPVRRFALIDRRSPDEQDKSPFVKSEHHWLDRKRR